MVFAGSREVNSMERINFKLLTCNRADWELILLPEEVFSPRRLLFVVPLNECEIALLGGEGENRSYLSDLVVFNVKLTSCSKVSDGGGSYKFTSGRNNQIALIGNNLIGLATKNLNTTSLF